MRAILPPGVKEFPLLEWDPSGDSKVTLKEHRSGETTERAHIWEQRVVERVLPNGIIEREIQEPILADVMGLDCWLTFISSTLKRVMVNDAGESFIDENGEPLLVDAFPEHMTREEFLAAFALLPDELTLEWHDKVLQLNPDWL